MKRIVIFMILMINFLFSKEFITFEEANLIAKNYKNIMSKKVFKKWKDVNITDIRRFYDIDGGIVGYDVSLGNSVGFFFISNDINEPLISFVSDIGSSITKTLVDYERDLIKQMKKYEIEIEEKRYFMSLPICYGIGFKIKNTKNFSLFKEANFQKGWYIFSPIKECSKVKYIRRFKKAKKINSDLFKKNKQLKEYLLNPKKSSPFFKNVNVKSVSFDKKSGHTKRMERYDFSNFYQVYGNWNNGNCFIGCSPVAWGILLEYWDRHGFGNLVGSVYDNNNRETKDPDVMYMLRQLRDYLGTFCKGNEGYTYYSNIERGIQYVYERGYGDSWAYMAMQYDPFSAWMTLINNINENMPVVANIHLPESNSGHSTVAYKYIDAENDINDRFCVKTGWRKLTDNCYSSHYLKNVVVVHIEKSQQIPPVANAGMDKKVVLGESIILDGSGSRDDDGYITEYVWSVNGHILGYGEKIKVTPPNAGRFIIKLTVTDNDGLSDEDTMILTVIRSAPTPSPTPSPKPVVLGSRMIVSALNGYCIDIAKADRSPGAKLITWQCHGGANQKWYYENGEIKSALNGYCIDIEGGDSSAGAKLITWQCHGGANQKWYYENGEIKSALNGYCIDIAKANPYQGAELIVWPCHGRSNQKWSFR